MNESSAEKGRGRVVTGTLLTIASALIFGLTPMLNTATYDMGGNPMTMTFYRSFIAFPVIWVMLKFRKTPLKISFKEGRDLALAAVFNITTSMLLFSSYAYIGIGMGTTLHFLYPVFTIIIGYVAFRDRLGKIKIISLIMATVGMIMATGSSGFNMTGIAVAAASGLTYAGYLLSLEKSSIGKMDTMKAMLYICIFSSLFTFITDLFADEVAYVLPAKAMIYTVIFAVLNSCVAHVILLKGVKYIGAGNASIYSMFEPVSSVIGGAVILHESTGPMKMLSCIVIFAAVLIPAVSDIRNDGQVTVQRD